MTQFNTSICDYSTQRLITPDKVSEILGISKGTLAVWRSIGRYNLPYVKIGSRVMYRLTDIQAFIEERLRDHT